MVSGTTRERILDAAMRLFHEQGYGATGVATILREAGVQSGSLYHFFASKEDLLAAVLERYFEMLYPMVMAPAFARTVDPIERVFAVLEGYREMLVMTSCTLGCPIGNLALEMGEGHTAVREKIVANFRQWCEAIEKCLVEAGDRLSSDVDRRALSRFVLTVMEGGLMQARAERDVTRYEAAVANLRQYFDHLMERAADAKGQADGGSVG